ncbi:MAG: DHH family phosphoesterase [Myxococcota bacterium]
MKMRIPEYKKCLDYLQKNILITSHRNPDGDAIGSALALMHICKIIGGTPTLYFQDQIGHEFKYLNGVESIVDSLDPQAEYDAVFALDLGTTNLLGKDIDLHSKRFGKIIVIDHHKTRNPFGDLEIVDVNASATGLLIEELMNTSNIKPVPHIAQAIWCAIYTDTGGFKYASTDSRTLECGSRMLAAGADPWEATQNIYESNPFQRMKLLGKALENLEIRNDGITAGMHVTTPMIEETGASIHMASSFVNFARSIFKVEIAFFVKPDLDNKLHSKVSFRSSGRYSVDAIARKFGGGGHKNAAGCKIEKPIAEARKMLFSAITEFLKNE